MYKLCKTEQSSARQRELELGLLEVMMQQRYEDITISQLCEKLQIPRGERYEMCRSVHAEANAIISAPRDQMLGATLYQTCVSPADGSIVGDICSCMMCKRMIINAGISRVVFRDTKEKFHIVDVQDWIENDDSLSGVFGY